MIDCFESLFRRFTRKVQKRKMNKSTEKKSG